MASKMVNFKMSEDEITEMKTVAGAFNMTSTDLIKNAIKAYLDTLKADPYYRLTNNVEEVSAEESEEILDMINSLNDDDLTISSTKIIKL
ncbi:MAG: hypothetical protein J6S72_01865 [Lachnospiraceae bacterium]|nr:hypothetical protein [Lachnospiraceae bacterium]